MDHKAWAKSLHESARSQTPRAQFSTEQTYSLEDAYHIQHALIAERIDRDLNFQRSKRTP